MLSRLESRQDDGNGNAAALRPAGRNDEIARRDFVKPGGKLRR
jgi:hypothetical protein